MEELKHYIGKKEVQATPMTMGEAYKEGLLQAGRTATDPDKEGYKVVYQDGYTSWSPAETFEKAYKISDTYIDRMKIELDEVLERSRKLADFMSTEKYKELSGPDRIFLNAQLGAMQAYYNILGLRIGISE